MPDPSGPAVLLLVVAGVLLVVSMIRPEGANLDRRIFTTINGRRLPSSAEAVVRLVSHLGLMPINVLVWLIIAVKLWSIAPSYGPPRLMFFNLLFPVVLPLIGLLVVWALCRVVKLFVRRTRPHLALLDARLVGRPPGGSSFPSSHAALATYSALLVTSWLRPAALAVLCVWMLVAVVAYARIYLGAHYPRDVVGGIALGSLGALGALAAIVIVEASLSTPP